MEIFDPYVFRKCNGWLDHSGQYRFSHTHTDYFIIPPREHSMPESVPKKLRCEGCEIAFRRSRTLTRVKRHRIQRKQKEILRNYISVYQMGLRGELTIAKSMIDNLRKIILNSGGELNDE